MSQINSANTRIRKLKSGEKIQVSGSPHLLWNLEDPVKIIAERYLCFNSSGDRLDGFTAK